MGEENNENKINTDEILKETSETINEVKDQVKGTFKKEEIKNSAKETKNFISGMFKNPVGELKNIAEDSSNATFKYAIILIIIWIVAVAILKIYNLSTWNIFRNVLLLIKAMLAPVLSILVLAVTLLVLNKKKGKSLITLISVVTATKLPIVIASVVNLLRLISSRITTITSPFSAFCTVLSAVLLYFGAKFVFEEEDDKEFIKTFAIIEGIFYIAYIVIGLLEIYI